MGKTSVADFVGYKLNKIIDRQIFANRCGDKSSADRISQEWDNLFSWQEEQRNPNFAKEYEEFLQLKRIKL